MMVDMDKVFFRSKLQELENKGGQKRNKQQGSVRPGIVAG